jgi:16S rRNA (uracil1498-N3)-methyltransferase
VRIPRIFTDQALAPGKNLLLEPQASHHLSHVLRLPVGAHLLLFNGSGAEHSARIIEISKLQLTVKVGEVVRHEPLAPLQIHLLLGISRGERMEFALQKAVELGVSGIQPLFTERCQVKLTGQRLTQRLAHWRRLIINACEQSGRCHLPEILEPVDLSRGLHCERLGLSLLLDPLAQQHLLDLAKPASKVALLVGPEGGLSARERTLAMQHGFIGIKLGPRILRSETAPLAAIAALQTLWGDLR